MQMHRVWADCAIPMFIGPEKAMCLYEIPRFNELTFEILEVGEVMRRNASRLPNGAIINCRSKACHGTPIQELAHLLQGLESELLHVVIEEYGNDILIIQHDGFALADYVDPAEIETILADTVYDKIVEGVADIARYLKVGPATNSDMEMDPLISLQHMKGVHRMAAAIRAGLVWINCHAIPDMAIPFGGYKQSGWGRENGYESLLQYTELKSVVARL